LTSNKYFPYVVKITQYLQPGDDVRRLEFCHWFLNKSNEDRSFHQKIIWSDECRITSCGIHNRHNERHWNSTNPHMVRPVRQQGRFGVNISCFLFQNKLVYRCFEENLNADRYMDIPQSNLFDILDDVPLNEVIEIDFQQDGAPTHNALRIREYLYTHFRNRWIGTHGPIRWPPRSPDLTPPDFFLWGVLENKIYKEVILTREQLDQRIHEAFAEIKPLHIMNALKSVRKRCQECIENNGGAFEHLR
jgi:hypothetical protein